VGIGEATSVRDCMKKPGIKSAPDFDRGSQVDAFSSWFLLRMGNPGLQQSQNDFTTIFFRFDGMTNLASYLNLESIFEP
jgi:hypothetical protein